jgi:hypothetical protein
MAILEEAFASGVFQTTLGADPIDVEPMSIQVDDDRWFKEARNKQPPRPQSQQRQKFIFDTIDELLEKGCIVESQAPAFSQVHVANKKEPGQFRFTIDYRALNEATQAKSWTIPNIELDVTTSRREKTALFRCNGFDVWLLPGANPS